MKKYLILSFFLLFCFIVRAGESFVAKKGVVSGSYNFWFHNPDIDNNPNAHYPLLIFLHGASLCGNNLNKVKRYGVIDAIAKGYNIETFIIAPQNSGGAWNPEKIMKIVDWVQANYCVDTTRIYVYGMSLGGYGTIDFAATYPNKVAAAMALCGGASKKDVSGLSKVPLWIVHGTADRAVPVSASDKVVDAIKATGDDSRLIYTRMPGVNHGQPARIFYLQQTYDWLFSHSLNDSNRPVNRDFYIDNEILKDAYNDVKYQKLGNDDFFN